MQWSIARTRITRGVLAGMVIVGSIALWTVVPLAWINFAAGLTEDGGTRFVLVILGCPLTMGLVLVVLSQIESYRQRLSPTSEPKPLLEVMLVVSALVALAALIVWWAFIPDVGDPSGPLQPI